MTPLFSFFFVFLFWGSLFSFSSFANEDPQSGSKGVGEALWNMFQQPLTPDASTPPSFPQTAPQNNSPNPPSTVPQSTPLPTSQDLETLSESSSSTSPNNSPTSSPTPEVRRAQPFTIIESSSEESAPPSQKIRLAPSTAETEIEKKEATLALANNAFLHHDEGEALEVYNSFLKMSEPGDPGRDQALFRKAETLRRLQQDLNAQKAYEELLQEVPSGNYRGLAAYRLGDYHYQRHEMQEAADSYHEAATYVTSPNIRQAALYQEALAQRELGEAEKASQLFDQAASSEENSNLHFEALLNQAFEEEQTSHPEKALTLYRKLLSAPKEKLPPELLSEALTKAGIILQHQGEEQEAASFFEKAIATKGENEWTPLAALGLLQLAAEKNEIQKIVQYSQLACSISDPKTRAQALLITGNAYRHLHQYQEARDCYQKIETEDPGSDVAAQAAFYRLLSLYQANDPSFLQEVSLFMETNPTPLHKAQADLLQGEYLFAQKKYQAAVTAYDAALSLTSELEQLNKAIIPPILYKKATALQQLGEQKAAREPLTKLISDYPESSLTPQALLERANLSQELGENDAALADDQLFLNSYPNSPLCETILERKATLLATQKNYPAVISTLAELLRRYPKTEAAPQAYFWSGWAYMEQKEYPQAIEAFQKVCHLPSSILRERATLRILLCYYELQDGTKALHVVEALPLKTIPTSLSEWLGEEAYQQGQMKEASRYLQHCYDPDQQQISATTSRGSSQKTPSSTLSKPSTNSTSSTPIKSSLSEEKLFHLANAYLAQSAWEAANPIIDTILQKANTPAERAQGLLLQAKIAMAHHQYDQVQKKSEEALLLQPEGKLNLAARHQLADLLAAQGKYTEAGKAYEALSLLETDPTAKEKEAQQAKASYQKASVQNP